ncbi:fibrinogen-like YCDxxxxGGGW domain-containing protein [Nannocystis pusilla]|uniref:DUF4215 domain-containing protein n=1 Tax=Nannocystis pusilla TaxID=889268 RepID=A0ABS7U1E4_9BACT|nr:fibrinogen-like YCDxxxxGGGW domain-containing protein [Nannocystis pusilla]MBZ5714264.1 DUF4215 domain-containing protein [Nannocystis pusilla]
MATCRRGLERCAGIVAALATAGCLDRNPEFVEPTLPTASDSLGASSTAADPTDAPPTSQGTTGPLTTDSDGSGGVTTTTSATLTTSDTLTTTTGAPVGCGDGMVEPPEECDDGPNNGDEAACTGTCKLAFCGDGLVYPGAMPNAEYCDDANDDPADGCVGCFVPHACEEIMAFGPPNLPSGLYLLDPEGIGEFVPAYCDMELQGGGWTRVERSPLADPIGHALYVDAEVNYDDPENERYRMPRAAMERVVQHSEEIWIDCGGSDHLWADPATALFLGEDAPGECYETALVHYKEARLGPLQIDDVELCTGFHGVNDGECPGAWRVDESEQMNCGLSMVPWNDEPYTFQADIFAVDPQISDPDKHQCHQDGAVRAILLR